MLTILATLLGIFGQAVPALLGIWEKKVDTESQIQLLQIQAQIAMDKDKFDAIVAQNQALIGDRVSARSFDTGSTGFVGLDFLRAAIRPVFAYTFFLLFIVAKASVVYYMTTASGIRWDVALPTVLDTETVQFFEAIFGYYFGGAIGARLLSK